jgi:hypothetical protein
MKKHKCLQILDSWEGQTNNPEVSDKNHELTFSVKIIQLKSTPLCQPVFVGDNHELII